MTRTHLHCATEMFVTNSLLEIMPIRRFDGADLPLGPSPSGLRTRIRASREGNLVEGAGPFPTPNTIGANQ